MNKDELRKKLKEERQALEHDNWMDLSQKACSKLLELQWIKDAERVALYSSKHNELSLNFAQHELLHMGKVVAYPRVTDQGLEFYQVDEETQFIKSSFDILEPISEKKLDEIQVYVIPALAFDISGYRLGWGKGYYDRALEKSYAKKIGVAFDFQILDDALPFEKHDVRMNRIITEKRDIEIL